MDEKEAKKGLVFTSEIKVTNSKEEEDQERTAR